MVESTEDKGYNDGSKSTSRQKEQRKINLIRFYSIGSLVISCTE